MMVASAFRDSVTELRPQEWRTADRFPALPSGELHVWLMHIDRSREHLLGSTLSPDELARAAQFRYPEHRAEFVVCRGALRSLLGHYVGLDPARVQIFYTDDGKPFLCHRSSSVKFNVSHAGEYALFAFSLGLDVGVDIERREAGGIDAGLLRHCLHDNELETYHALAADEQGPFFFKCWTRKEAYLKFRGDGFAVSPTAIDLQSIRGNELGPGESRAWFSDLPEIDAYSAVIATKDQPESIACYKLGSSPFK